MARPAAPTGPAPAAAGADAHTVEDDDAVIVPAPDASVFLHKPDYAGKKPKGPAFGQSARFRQTFIPILLTGGLIMIGLGALHFLWQAENNPTNGLPVWLVGALFLLGAALWGLAVANMLSVKHILDAQRKSAS